MSGWYPLPTRIGQCQADGGVLIGIGRRGVKSITAAGSCVDVRSSHTEPRPLWGTPGMPLVGGVSGDPARPDNIVYDIMPTAGGGMLDPVGTWSKSAGGYGHPMCSPVTPNPNTLPAVQTP